VNYHFLYTFLPVNLNVSRIREIQFRRKGSVGIGIGTGLLLGGIIGGIIGSASDSPDPPHAFIHTNGIITALGALIGIASGSIIGGIIGSASKKIPIHGNMKTYRNKRLEMMNYSVTGN